MTYILNNETSSLVNDADAVNYLDLDNLNGINYFQAVIYFEENNVRSDLNSFPFDGFIKIEQIQNDYFNLIAFMPKKEYSDANETKNLRNSILPDPSFYQTNMPRNLIRDFHSKMAHKEYNIKHITNQEKEYKNKKIIMEIKNNKENKVINDKFCLIKPNLIKII